MKIAVIGTGYVGSVTGTCLAEMGHEIFFVDSDISKLSCIASGKFSLHEPRLDNLLARNLPRIRTTIDIAEAVHETELSLICVGTPMNNRGATDLGFVKAVAHEIGRSLRSRIHYYTIVVKSTVPPGTTNTTVQPILEKESGKQAGTDFGLGSSPEFLREGHAVEDFFHPDRIIIGADDAKTSDIIQNLFCPLDAPIFTTGTATAEMIKYVSNAFLATKISFANEMGNLCKASGIDVYEVMKGVGLDRRIGPHHLDAGAGFGGSCFQKDVSALISMAETLGEDPVLLKSVMNVNDLQPLRMIRLLTDKIGMLDNKRISVLGLAFKDNTDDVRNSQSIRVIQELLNSGALVAVYDPVAAPNMKKIFPDLEYCRSAAEALQNAEGCLVMTEWPEFGLLDREFEGMKNRIIIEGRRILSCDDTDGICW